MQLVRTPADEAVALSESPVERKNLRWWLAAMLAIVTLVAGSLLTNIALVNGWVGSVAGPLYTEADHNIAAEDARVDGFSEGEDVGYAEGLAFGKSEGEQVGFETGYDAGERVGFSEGLDAGLADGYDTGFNDGYDTAFDDAYYEGYFGGWTDGCLFLFDGLGTDRVGDWWDYYYSPSYASYYDRSACD